MDPESIYRQAEDKQRIVITGNQAPVITSMIVFTLRTFSRKFDFVRDGEVSGDQSVNESDAPLLIIEDNRKPYTSLVGYHHHIGVISAIDDTAETERNITAFADGTPKAGILLYDEKGPSLEIGKKPRPDVTATPYGAYATKDENGTLFLITSTNERFPVRVRGEQNLRSISAAKEILKKTGITSGQFYQAMTMFEG